MTLLTGRNPALPAHLTRPGQLVPVNVLQTAPKPDGAAQVQVAGKVMYAVLPAGVSAGQQLQAQVTRAADGRIELRLQDPKQEGAPPASRVAGRDSSARQLAPPGAATATPAPTVQMVASKLPDALRAALQPGQRVEVHVTAAQPGRPAEVRVLGHHLPAAAMTAPGNALTQGALFNARVVATSQGRIELRPEQGATSRSTQLQRAAGELIVETPGDPARTETALHLAAAADRATTRNAVTYSPTGEPVRDVSRPAVPDTLTASSSETAAPDTAQGAPVDATVARTPESLPHEAPIGLSGMIELPDGRQVGFAVDPDERQAPPGASSTLASAQLALHGLALGPIALHIQVADGVSSVRVTADTDAQPVLKERVGLLTEALQQALGRPAQVSVTSRAATELRPTPPGGFQVYG